MSDSTPESPAIAPEKAALAANAEMVNKAFSALPTYDFGSSRGLLVPLDDAVAAAWNDASARGDLERRLLAVLAAKVSPTAQAYIFSKLGLIGSAESVPALADCLAESGLAHAAEIALQAIPCDEAATAIRDRLPKLSGLDRVGAVNCLGMRRDAQSVSLVATLLADPDPQVKRAALAALGNIGTMEAAQSLQAFQPNAADSIGPALADALLACAERLLATGDTTQPLAIYKSLTDAQQPKHVRLAAHRGLLNIQKL